MNPAPTRARGGLDPEGWLRSRGRRWLLVALAVLLASLATTFEIHELMQGWRGGRGPGRGPDRDPEWTTIFLGQLAVWCAWGLAAVPLVWLAARTARSWILFLLVHVPLSIAAAYAALALRVLLSPWSYRRFGEVLELSDLIHVVDRMASRRLPRELLTYWLILGLGAGLRIYLKTRDEQRRAATAELRASQLDTELARAQIDSLRGQVHPHFLFNALHTIGGLIREDDQAAALRVLSAVGDLLRTTLDQGEAPEVPLSEELEVAERYLGIERIRFGDRLETSVEVEPAARAASVPALVLLPLVENAVRHGVEPRTGGGRVEIAARRSGGELVLEVRDDGPGYPREVLEGSGAELEHDGRRRIGLANTRKRLRVLYGEEYGLTLSNPAEGGALARIRIPCREAGGGDA